MLVLLVDSPEKRPQTVKYTTLHDKYSIRYELVYTKDSSGVSMFSDNVMFKSRVSSVLKDIEFENISIAPFGMFACLSLALGIIIHEIAKFCT